MTMNIGILLYYLCIIIAWFPMYLLLICAYEDEKFENKVKYPLWLYISCLIGSLVPAVNLIEGICLFVYIVVSKNAHDLYIKHWLFKKY